jgi:hypothetical protein
MSQSDQSAGDKYANFEGPTEDERTHALRAMRINEGHSSFTGSTGALKQGTPRKGKFPHMLIAGIRTS